jgi:hypothetical protein
MLRAAMIAASRSLGSARAGAPAAARAASRLAARAARPPAPVTMDEKV